MSKAAAKKPEELFEDIRLFMAEKLALLDVTPLTSLEGMDGKVLEICKAIESMPMDDAKKYKEELEGLQKQLTVLGECLLAERDAIQAQLQGLGMQKKAHAAYKTTDVIGGPQRPDGNEP